MAKTLETTSRERDVLAIMEGKTLAELEGIVSRLDEERASIAEKVRAGITPIPEINVSGLSMALADRRADGHFDVLGLPALFETIAAKLEATGEVEIAIPYVLATLLASTLQFTSPNPPQNYLLDDWMEYLWLTEVPRLLKQDHGISVEIELTSPGSSSPEISDEAKNYWTDFRVVYKKKEV